MCYTFRRIVSEPLNKNGHRNILEFIGCSSLRNFAEHLEDNSCDDYDSSKLRKIVDACQQCEKDRSIVHEIALIEDPIEYKTRVVRDYQKAMDILKSLEAFERLV